VILEKQKVDRKSPEEQPCYSLTEASRYLLIPPATLRSWVVGRKYPTESGPRFFRPVIQLPDDVRAGLSFVNLVEAHVLDAIRRHHQVPLSKIRDAITYLRKQFSSRHPLAEQRFETDGIDLFIEEVGRLVNASRGGQIAMASVLRAYLKRVERDPAGVPIKLYPFTRRSAAADAPAPVVIDARVAFGRPVLSGRGVPTAVLADRFKAGDLLDDLAKDYETTPQAIEEAIRCELDRRQAA